jgi:hypothetical protein
LAILLRVAYAAGGVVLAAVILAAPVSLMVRFGGPGAWCAST